jgi:hypothetical protein
VSFKQILVNVCFTRNKTSWHTCTNIIIE